SSDLRLRAERHGGIRLGEEREQRVEVVHEADAAERERAGTDERDVRRESEAQLAEPRGLAERDRAARATDEAVHVPASDDARCRAHQRNADRGLAEDDGLEREIERNDEIGAE